MRLIEPGSGSSAKTRILLDAMQPPASYVCVDISRSHLMTAARALAERYPGIEILPVCADFTQPFEIPAGTTATESTLVFFPGSTIGNFDRSEAIALLAMMRELAGAEGRVLVGADLRKSPHILEAAYNDAAGVTAEFNLNLLARLNHEFGADFDLERIHASRAVGGRAESHRNASRQRLRRQTVHIGGAEIEFESRRVDLDRELPQVRSCSVRRDGA